MKSVIHTLAFQSRWWFEHVPQWFRANFTCCWHVIADGCQVVPFMLNEWWLCAMKNQIIKYPNWSILILTSLVICNSATCAFSTGFLLSPSPAYKIWNANQWFWSNDFYLHTLACYLENPWYFFSISSYHISLCHRSHMKQFATKDTNALKIIRN